MQNFDFANSINNKRVFNSGKTQESRRNQHYRQNSDFHRDTGDSTSPKKIFSVFYVVILFLFIGFSGGTLTGLYLAKSNVAVQKIITNNKNTTPKIVENQSKHDNTLQGIISLKNTSPSPKDDFQKNKTQNNIIENKKYLIYTGKFQKGIAYRLGYYLKEKNIPAFLVKTKKYTKLYVGSFDNLEITKKILKKIKKTSPEYFQNAIIKVHSSSSKKK